MCKSVFFVFMTPIFLRSLPNVVYKHRRPIFNCDLRSVETVLNSFVDGIKAGFDSLAVLPVEVLCALILIELSDLVIAGKLHPPIEDRVYYHNRLQFSIFRL